MSKSAFGIDHGVISKEFTRRPFTGQEQDPAGVAVLGGAAGAGGYAALGGGRPALKGVNRKLKADRAAGAKIPRTVAGMSRVGGSAGGTMGRIVGRPGKTALIGGAGAALAGGAQMLHNKKLRRQQSG